MKMTAAASVVVIVVRVKLMTFDCAEACECVCLFAFMWDKQNNDHFDAEMGKFLSWEPRKFDIFFTIQNTPLFQYICEHVEFVDWYHDECIEVPKHSI